MNLMIVNDGSSTTAQVAMTLAAIAYANHKEIPNLLANQQLATQGRWQLQWLGTDDANQAYIAQDQQTGQFSVNIRGSVTDPLSEAFWLDWFKQDLEVLDMGHWPHGGAPTGTKVSYGTLAGLRSLLNLKNHSGQTLIDFLSTNLKPGVSPLTGITGHSLGGALASVLAPYLHQQFSPGQQVLDFWPITFAGPSAGNAVFANWLTQQFAASQGRYFNALDVVPHAWQELAWIEKSFPNGGPSLSLVIKELMKGVADLLKLVKDSYIQPGNGMPLPGTLQSGDDWVTEAGQQHASATYLSLVGAPPVPIS